MVVIGKHNLRDFLSAGTWDQLGASAVDWTLKSVPAVAVVLLLSTITLRVSRGLIQGLKPRMLRHMLESHDGEASEIEKQIETLFGILQGTIRVVVGFVALMLVLRNIGIDIAPILAGAGVVGLAVGFGAQELVRDVISGFFMLLENHIRTGDVVQVNGTAGLVERVGLRALVLRDVTGTVHVFQNGKVSTLANMTKGWSAAVFDVGVAYQSNIDLVIRTMHEVSEELRVDPTMGRLILEPMEVFGVEAFGNSEVTIKARLKTKPSQQWSIGREYRKRLKLAFDRAGIEMPLAQRTVWLQETPKALTEASPPEVRVQARS